MRYPYRIWAEIDIKAFSENISRIRTVVGKNKGIILVVKADAYGHDAIQISKAAQFLGIDMLGVGDSGEALELIESGIKIPILILGTVIDEEVKIIAKQGIHVGVHSSSRLDFFSREAINARRRLKVHLNIDTGMGRLGVPPSQALKVTKAILSKPGLEFAGIYTHFASTSIPPGKDTIKQEIVFKEVLNLLKKEGVLPKKAISHASSSCSLFGGIGVDFDAVRPGIAAYGIIPGKDSALFGLKPIMSLKSQIIFYKDINPGTPVGYESRWKAKEKSRIATIPAGYNDGIPWRLGDSGKGFAIIRGKRVPIIGRISMDYTCIDISKVPGVGIGEPVVLIGRDGEEEITVNEIAEASGTSPYEVICHIGKRVKRVHKSILVEPAIS